MIITENTYIETNEEPEEKPVKDAVEILKKLSEENEYLRLRFNPWNLGVCEIDKGFYEPTYDIEGNPIADEEPHMTAAEPTEYTFGYMTEEDEEYIVTEAEKLGNVKIVSGRYW
jgi:hypothetical protein